MARAARPISELHQSNFSLSKHSPPDSNASIKNQPRKKWGETIFFSALSIGLLLFHERLGQDTNQRVHSNSCDFFKKGVNAHESKEFLFNSKEMENFHSLVFLPPRHAQCLLLTVYKEAMQSVNIIFISGSSSNTNRSKTEAMCKYHFISGPTNTHHTWDTVFSPNTSFWNSNQIQQRCLELESFFWMKTEMRNVPTFVSGGNVPKLINFLYLVEMSRN